MKLRDLTWFFFLVEKFQLTICSSNETKYTFNPIRNELQNKIADSDFFFSKITAYIAFHWSPLKCTVWRNCVIYFFSWKVGIIVRFLNWLDKYRNNFFDLDVPMITHLFWWVGGIRTYASFLKYLKPFFSLLLNIFVNE